MTAPRTPVEPRDEFTTLIVKLRTSNWNMRTPDELACMIADMLERVTDRLWPVTPLAVQEGRGHIRALIADDSYACTFQTFGQYRSALLKAIDALATPLAVQATDEREAFRLSLLQNEAAGAQFSPHTMLAAFDHGRATARAQLAQAPAALTEEQIGRMWSKRVQGLYAEAVGFARDVEAFHGIPADTLPKKTARRGLLDAVDKQARDDFDLR